MYALRFEKHKDKKENIYNNLHREGLALVAEEGLENCWRRHRLCADHLHSGLKDLGLELFVANPAARLPTVTTIKVPEGINWQAVAGHCMKK